MARSQVDNKGGLWGRFKSMLPGAGGNIVDETKRGMPMPNPVPPKLASDWGVSRDQGPTTGNYVDESKRGLQMQSPVPDRAAAGLASDWGTSRTPMPIDPTDFWGTGAMGQDLSSIANATSGTPDLIDTMMGLGKLYYTHCTKRRGAFCSIYGVNT